MGKMKKIFSVILRILSILITVFAICMMIFTITAANVFGKTEKSLFGFKFFIVLSDSMKDEFQAGDVVISKVVDVNTIEPGDIITFRSVDPMSFGEVVTHKVREETVYEGAKAFVTYGTATGTPDSTPVPVEQVIGKYQTALPKLGFFLQFLKTTPGYITLILVPFLILIFWQGLRFFKTVQQYRKLQQAELEEQRAALEEERRQTQQMLRELEELRSQLKPGEDAMAAQDAPGASDAPAEESESSL